MRVLVTGAAGFIGSHTVERLLAEGHEVIGLDNFDDFYDRAVKRANLEAASASPDFRLVRGDIRDTSCLEALPADIEAVVHLAARAGVRPSLRDPLLYQEVNVRGTQLLLEHARERSIGSFLFASSSSVYGEAPTVPFREDQRVDRPISPYAATKVAGEALCHTYHHLYGMSILALRFFTVYGPRQRPDLAIHKFARLMTSGRPIEQYGDGSSERDYTYVDDTVEGVAAALAYAGSHPGCFEVVNLGHSRTVSLRRLISLLSDALQVEPRILRRPPQPGDVELTFADISTARRLLGYEPRVSIEEGIERFVRWFRMREEDGAR